MSSFDQQFDIYLSSKNVGPEARRKLSGLLKYYAKKPHPFRACVRDNRKRFGPGRTEAVCATLKDIIRGTTHWRNNKDKDKGAAGLSNLSEDNSKLEHGQGEDVLEFAQNAENNVPVDLPQSVVDAIDSLSDEQLEDLIELAKNELDDEEDSDTIWEEPPVESNYKESDDPQVNCAHCDHYKEGLCELHIAKAEPEMVCDEFEGGREETDSEAEDPVYMSELYFSESPSAVKDKNAKGIWKTVLRTGQWKLSPNGGRQTSDPLTIVRGQGKTKADGKTISLDDIVETFNNNAMQHVTVPLEHTSAPDKNTGYVKDLVLESDDNGDYLKALIDFTEPDIEQKVLNGSIADTSVGLKFGYRRKRDGEKFPVVLDHVALTNKPWIDGLPSFGLSETNSENVPIFVYAETEYTDGGKKMEKEVIDTSKTDLQLSELQDKNTLLAEENSTLSNKNSELASKLRRIEVGEKVTELSQTGLGEYPGFLKKVEQILLADQGQEVLELSEDGESKSMTASDIVETLIESLPKKDLTLSEQAHDVGGKKPAVDASDENLSLDERTNKAADYLKIKFRDKGE